ncbi:hypothetical protein NEF87_001067 [Candidatus Lokiarchaeum ossiferum]|uniref:Peptidase C45 hydrolase domain-containing protein n=1 Tax=Candidatus Lokiarchaeum ossiferum TaxID=2951803 RepID=A0ABY6HQV4_9ARCH|nr:hypothetical protein NEF87_001067 [Candidatus Lokiarchaeum sp. B-35]
MFEIELIGNWYEMGKQYGMIMKHSPFQAPIYDENMMHRYEFAEKCEQQVKNYAPDLIEFLKGFAEGGSYDYDMIKVLPLVLNYGWEPPKPSCTISYISSEYSATGHPFMLRNYDWDYSSEKIMAKMILSPTNGNKSISFTDLWGGAYGGINQKGLLIGITAAATYDGEWIPGVMMNLLVQWVLTHYSTAQEAANYIKSVPHTGAFHYFVVDQDRNIARILGTPDGVVVDLFNDENVIQTNHIIVDSMIDRQDESRMPVSSPIRFENVQKWLAKQKGKINSVKIKEFCSLSHSKGGIHEDGDFMGIKFGTIWSWFYDFQEHAFYLSPGNPLHHEYQKISF